MMSRFWLVHLLLTCYYMSLADCLYDKGCHGLLYYKAKPISIQEVDPYFITEAPTEFECALKCFETSAFCRSAVFDAGNGVCLFSYHRHICNAVGLTDGPTYFKDGPVLILCLECHKIDGQKSAIGFKPRDMTTTTGATSLMPSTVGFTDMTQSNMVRKSVNTFRNPLLRLKTRTETLETMAPAPPPQAYSRTTALPPVPRDGHFIGADLPRRKLNRVLVATGVGRNPPLFKEVAVTRYTAKTSKDFFFAEPTIPYGRARENVPQKEANCSDVMLLPCSFRVGRGCGLIADLDGCLVCTCGERSVSHGCLGPLFMNEKMRVALVMHRKVCDNGRYAQNVVRYYRRMARSADGDECVPMQFPYCGYDIRKNLPRTRRECMYNCFSNTELLAMGESFQQILQFG